VKWRVAPLSFGIELVASSATRLLGLLVAGCLALTLALALVSVEETSLAARTRGCFLHLTVAAIIILPLWEAIYDARGPLTILAD